MVSYELSFIFPSKDNITQTKFVDEIKALVESVSAKVLEIENKGRKTLAYPIQKQTEGIYAFITFEAELDAVSEIEKKLKLQENVIRYLILKKVERKEKKQKSKRKETES